MKKVLILLSAVALLAVTGCETIKKALYDQAPVVVPASTNAVTGVVTPAVTNVVLTPKESITNGAKTAEGYAGALPPPYGTIAGGLLALALAGVSIYAKQQNGQLSTAQSVIQAVVTGVEAVGHPETKAAIQNAAVAAGVQADLHPVVQDTTLAMK